MSSGWATLLVAGVVATGTVLVRAGVAHVWDPTSLAGSLSAGLQHRWLGSAVRLWGIVEVALGAGLVIALLRPGPWAVAAATVTGVVLTGYVFWLVRRSRSERPWCACTAAEVPINLATIVRPLAMALQAFGLAFSSRGWPIFGGLAVFELAGAVLAGVGVGMIGWFYPEAVATTRDRLLVSVTT